MQGGPRRCASIPIPSNRTPKYRPRGRSAAEWGVLIADGKNFFTTAPWIALFPGTVIVIAGVGFSLTGDGLADLLEVKR